MIYYIQKKGKGFEFEMYEQVKFEIVNSDIGEVGEVLGGIGIFGGNNGDVLINVICGCCGGVLEPNDVKIIERYIDCWVDISDAIIGN